MDHGLAVVYRRLGCGDVGRGLVGEVCGQELGAGRGTGFDAAVLPAAVVAGGLVVLCAVVDAAADAAADAAEAEGGSQHPG